MRKFIFTILLISLRRLIKSIIFLSILFFISFQNFLIAQKFNIDTVINSGRYDNRLNVVYLGDGYTDNELSKFKSDIIQLSEAFFKYSPLKEYRNYVNIYRIDVPSKESGVTHDSAFGASCSGVPKMKHNTYYGCKFDGGSVHRLLVPTNYQGIVNVLANNLPWFDVCFMISNTSYYGGSGGLCATVSMASSANEILVHEFGHSFAALGDEYSYAGSSPRESPNTTKQTIRDSIRWNEWIDETTPVPTPPDTQYYSVVGLFEGAAYNPKGWFRPKYNCMMRSLGVPFCEVCSEAILMTLLNNVNPIDNYMPLELIQQGIDNPITFSLDLIKPEPNTLKTEWFLDSVLVASQTDSLTINPLDLSTGLHKLAVAVFDTTDMIKSYLHNIQHISTIEWEIDNKVSSVELISSLSRIQVKTYPNPFDDVINIEIAPELSPKFVIKLYDIKGKVLFTKIISDIGFKRIIGINTKELNLLSGTYILTLEYNGIIASFKLIKI